MTIARAVLAATALVLAVLAWTPGLNGPYVFDDHVTPLADPASQSLSAWVGHLGVTLRPVTKLTYAAEANAGLTDSPGARRAVTLVMHAATAVLLFLLITTLAPSATMVGAAVLAAIWFVHPVHADGVLMVSGRTAELSNLFAIAALLTFARSNRWLAALFFALACLARETALAVLIPLAVITVMKHQKQWRSALRELAPVLGMAAFVIAWIVTTPRYMALAEYSMAGRPLWASFVRQVGAIPVGFGLLFYPQALSIDYGIPLPTHAWQLLFLLGSLMYVGAALGIVLLLRRRPAVAVGLAIWLAALLPTQSIVPKLDALANRPLSLAFAGLLLAVAPWVGAAFRHAAELLRGALDGTSQWRAIGAVAIAAVIFTALAIHTSRRAMLFQSPLALWADAAMKSTANERPHVNYAMLLRQEGRTSEALEEIKIAARIDPFSSQIDTMLRVLRSQEGSR